MARVNHNVNYIYDVDGETVWEKLRVIRGFLQDREMAYEVAKLSMEDIDAMDKDSKEYKKAMIFKPQTEQNIQDCVNEIQFLKSYESALAIEAEKTRIDGLTDDQMYEANFYNEIKYRLVRKAQAQIISSGRIEVETLERIIKNKDVLNLCIEQKLLTGDVLSFTNVDKLPNYSVDIKLIEGVNND